MKVRFKFTEDGFQKVLIGKKCHESENFIEMEANGYYIIDKKNNKLYKGDKELQLDDFVYLKEIN